MEPIDYELMTNAPMNVVEDQLTEKGFERPSRFDPSLFFGKDITIYVKEADMMHREEYEELSQDPEYVRNPLTNIFSDTLDQDSCGLSLDELSERIENEMRSIGLTLRNAGFEAHFYGSVIGEDLTKEYKGTLSLSE